MAKTIGVVVALLVVAAAAWYVLGDNVGSSHTFTDPKTSETISVVFDTGAQTATLSGLGYSNLVFGQAVSASGARYVNDWEHLELWNRGEEITLSRNGRPIFSGNIKGASNEEKLAEGVWVWQGTLIQNKAAIEPRKADAFTLRFDNARRTVSGTTDCNNFSSSYVTSADGVLAFGLFTVTKKFCEGAQESEFLQLLSEANTFMFTGAGDLTMQLRNNSGSMIFSR